MLNHIDIMGRLTRDPELRHTPSGVAVAVFTLAVDRDFQPKDSGDKETDFIDTVAWRQTGEFAAKYLAKGRMVVVSGRLQIRKWRDKEYRPRSTPEIVASNIYFADSKRDGDGGAAGNRGTPAQQSFGTYSAGAEDFVEVSCSDDGLPF